jgi:arylsulfatase A-like enzyme
MTTRETGSTSNSGIASRGASVAVGALLVGVFAGLGVGIYRVFQNEYVERDLLYLAFHTVTARVNRYLYVVAIIGAVSVVFFAGMRLAVRNLRVLPLYILAVAAIAYAARQMEIDYWLDIPWRDMKPALRATLVGWVVVCSDLVIGRRWLTLGLLRRRARSLRFGLCAAALAVPLALNVSEAAWQNRLEARLENKPNFMVFFIDALRSDHVGCYGYHHDTTPTIDSLAAEGVRFTNAASNSNITRRTVPAIFTLLSPSALGIEGETTKMAPRPVTLAELLKNAGYRTLCYIPNPSMRLPLNYGQGFDVYDDKIFYRRRFRSWESQSVINERMLRWFERNRDKPYFVYIHNCDVHGPYSPPPPYDRMFYDENAEIRPISEGEYDMMHGYQRIREDRNDLNYYIALYDGELRYVDTKLRELLDGMKSLGLADNTVLFISADHGEQFLEHGRWDHGRDAYDPVVRVPLIMHDPREPCDGLTIEAPVHTFDISATVLDLAGVPAEPEHQANSLMPLVTGEVDRTWEYSFIDSEDCRALRNERWKFIADLKHGDEMLFDLAADPGELVNLVGVDTTQAGELRRKMAAIVAANSSIAQGGFLEYHELDAESIEQLKALGYIE